MPSAKVRKIAVLTGGGDCPGLNAVIRAVAKTAMNDMILDYVEDVLGPNFYLWGSNFFIKPPHSSSTVGWHQDTYYWPLEPKISATVWLAFEDVNEENAAMQVIPGSHTAGLLKHSRSSDTDSVLTLECERGQFREDSAVSLNLKAGQISIHDDKLVHGSPANHSNRRRAGLTVRYSTTEVKCDLSVNPHFRTYLCRAMDEYRHNPVGTVPTQQFGRLDEREQKILTLRFGLDDDEPMTLGDIGKVFGVTRERIRQIQVEALCKLRGALEDDGIRSHEFN